MEVQRLNSIPSDSFPELKASELLSLFGGSEENVNYFLSLKETLAYHRANGKQLYCDPRDHEMVKRLEEAEWRPQITYKYSEKVGFTSKQTALNDDAPQSEGGDLTEMTHDSDPKKSFVCGVNGCHQVFTTIASHESHYQNSHAFACATCKRTFVSNFLLDIHLQENHDSYFQILSPRIDMYRCLVESCDQKFRTAELRKDHLVSQHKYPANFTFHGLISSKAKVQSKETSSTSSSLMETDGVETQCQNVKSKGKKKSKGRGKSVPAVISFGYHGSHRAFPKRGKGSHWHQLGKKDVDTTIDIETVKFSDLADTLVE
ncbi:zinc finger protein 511-like [Physella acuta]|uniref:zinc finger protein 511-like n=1 Tax=Physella acuta TaxID=109671 RepID=UPI0027DB3DCF|nr:zinc finger protein 511-like [Physella acuta]XP_059142620.1 zinc finger protein 511-like [Physella acuta]